MRFLLAVCVVCFHFSLFAFDDTLMTWYFVIIHDFDWLWFHSFRFVRFGLVWFVLNWYFEAIRFIWFNMISICRRRRRRKKPKTLWFCAFIMNLCVRKASEGERRRVTKTEFLFIACRYTRKNNSYTKEANKGNNTETLFKWHTERQISTQRQKNEEKEEDDAIIYFYIMLATLIYRLLDVIDGSIEWHCRARTRELSFYSFVIIFSFEIFRFAYKYYIYWLSFNRSYRQIECPSPPFNWFRPICVDLHYTILHGMWLNRWML